MSDVFAIQTEIATEIVEELRIALTGALPALDQTSPEVHWLYLRARHILDTPELSRLAYARAMLEQAVEDDPNYFPARYQLAKAYFYLGVSGELERAKGLSLVERTMEQAALQWGDRPEIMTFRALMAFENRDYATAAQYLERSLQQDPSPSEPWAMAVNLLNRLGRHEDAIQVGEHVLLRNPICAPCYQALMLNHFMVREFEEAVDIYAQAENIGLELFPDFWYAAALLFSGDAEAALAEYQRDGMGRLPKLAGSAMALHELGQTPEYDQTLAELVQNELVRSEPENGVFPAMVYAFVGDKARAFEFLNSLPQPDALIFSDPHFDSLREDPRFEDLLKRSNIWPDDPRDEIEFNFELPE